MIMSKNEIEPISDEDFNMILDIIGEQVNERKEIVNAIMNDNLSDDEFERMIIDK